MRSIAPVSVPFTSCSLSPMLESRQIVFLPQAQRVPAGFLAIDCYAKSGNPPSAGYVNNSYCS
ncbi:hypothetical protein QUB75_00955 [Microcoleus sp. K1-B6]|uniref:hypothetical protein n=1 Tax=unclassified Microcoleus TaxID=2642155 RepID=UPI002FD43FDC